MSTIPLAKPFNSSKLNFPVIVSEKIDGVPILVTVTVPLPGGAYEEFTAVSRQGKPCLSVHEDMDALEDAIFEVYKGAGGRTFQFLFEVTHKDFENFQDISGVVRRQEPQEGLVYNLIDYNSFGPELDSVPVGLDYAIRMACGRSILHTATTELGAGKYAVPAEKYPTVKWELFRDEASLQEFLDQPIPDKQEGWIVRDANAPWKPGTRHWDYQKVVKEPTLDLLFVGVEEAVSKDGEPLGMVGRLIAKYKGDRIGIGPGKMSHKAREEVWETYKKSGAFIPAVGEVKHKPDAGYRALRQPTWQCWRHEKELHEVDA